MGRVLLVVLVALLAVACGTEPVAEQAVSAPASWAVNFVCTADGSFYVATVEASGDSDARLSAVAVAERTCSTVRASGVRIGSASLLKGVR